VPFQFETFDIPGLVLARPRRFDDRRGWFLESYKRSEFAEAGIDLPFVQDNLSRSARGTIRALHLQLPPYEQGKLVWVVQGRAWDVAVDLRPDSPTYLQWHGVELSAESQDLFYLPPGFAHGFCALADDTLLQYKCTAEYDRASERGIRFDDPDLAIAWPDVEPILSDRDRELPSLREYLAERGFPPPAGDR